jgi:hypothetical protein
MQIQVSNGEQRMKNMTCNKQMQKIAALIFCLTLLLLSAVSVSFAQDITLAWDSNQESGIASYNVYFTEVETQQAWQEPGPAHDPSTNVVTYQILGLDGTRQHCFEVTSVSDSGLESPFSNKVCTTVASACTDADSDGFSVEGNACGPIDCNDNDSSINPDAFENCFDGVDNNCNRLIDAADSTASSCPVTTPMSEPFGVYRGGAWFIDNNGNGAWDTGTDTTYASFGGAGDLPVIGDWNGDRTPQIGVFRNGAWYLDANGNGGWDQGTDTVYASFGAPSDLPVAGDWNGDGSSQIGVFRNGAWYLDNGNGVWNPGVDVVYANFGAPGDIPVIGDWNGDGSSQIGVFRNGAWYLDANGNGAWDPGTDTVYASFGGAGDLPVIGVWK